MARGGDVGVNTFFVLSGFLITALMVEERSRRHGVHLGRFYARRALRLFPALFTAALLVSLFVLASHGRAFEDHTVSGLPAVLFYFGNWARAADGAALGLFSHTWSLAIEEQFYLVWPVVFIVTLRFTRSYRALLLLTLTLATLSTLWRYRLWATTGDVLRVAGGSDTRAASLLFGCALGIIMMRRPFRMSSLFGWAGLAVLGLLIVVPLSNRYTYFLTVADAAGLCLVAALVLNPKKALGRFGAIAPLVLIGRISYGLYVWHYPIFKIIQARLHVAKPALIAVEFLAAFVVAGLSYKFVEEPALRLKNRLAARDRIASLPPVGTDGLSSDAGVFAAGGTPDEAR